MTIQRTMTFLSAAVISLLLASSTGLAQTEKTYQQMSRAERSTFVAAQARRMARELSGRDYEFTPGFEEDIQQSLNSYTRRLESSAKRDLRVTLERGRSHAATLMTPFRSRNLSPLMGLYIPFIESEFVNIASPTPMGSIGMFQFIPQTGAHYGLTPQDLLDVAKSADAAARYINDSINAFSDDPMKEALAILAYNRGTDNTLRDIKMLVNDQNRQCSICALNAGRGKLDNDFRQESVYYVPRFFAAAIIGENPEAFGLQTRPLSSY